MTGELWSEKLHQQFLKRMAASGPAVLAFAAHLYNRGFVFEVHPPKMSPSPDQNIYYTDDGDIFILGGTRRRIEVKGSGYDWTCLEDWPFPHFYFSNVGAVARAKGSVTAYVVVNKALTHAGVVLPDTTDEWYDHTCTPKNLDGRSETYKCCPKESVRFIRL